MKIPKTLKIAGHKVEVFNNHHFQEREDVDGHGNLTNNFIMIGDTIESESQRASVFLHEIMHFIVYRYLANLNSLKEETIDSLTEGLFQVLRDNKLNFSDEEE